MRHATLAMSVAICGLATGCDYTGDWLFAGAVDGIPGVYVLEGENQADFVPASVFNQAEAARNTVYAEMAPTGTAELGGVTFTFRGTGEDICVWVDPEVAFWNQSVAVSGGQRKWSYPDNVFDDGDIDMFVGLSVYYTGTPGEVIGDFEVRYEDSLGNEVPIGLVECTVAGLQFPEGAHAGRGSPEYCSVFGSRENISYTVLLQLWSTPLDDDRLGYGVLLTDTDCGTLRSRLAVSAAQADECVIRGEAIMPTASNYGPYYGLDLERPWPGSVAFEDAFCDEDANMRQYCVAEAEAKAEAGIQCQFNEVTDVDARCYCGDLSATPAPGGN